MAIRTMPGFLETGNLKAKTRDEESEPMTRKWYVAVPVVLLAMTVAMAASAQALRTAQVGDRMGFLVTGLRKVDGGALGSCAPGAPVISYVDYVVPGRPPDDDNASFQAFTAGDHIVAMIAYDEQDLAAPVAIYADMDGKGLVTNVWSVTNVPTLCAIMKDLRYQP